MSDRELLELAAKAAGISIEWRPGCGLAYALSREEARAQGRLYWNPLTEDGDSFRLAVKLRLTIEHNDPRDSSAWAMAFPSDQMCGPGEDVRDELERPAATRRAIVRAAAALAQGDHHGR